MLNRMGISTVGELACLPSPFLKQTFGAMGEVMRRYANGIDDRKVEHPAPPRSLSRETTFARDTSDNAFLGATLHYLSERVGAELRAQGKQARCITLKLRYADFQTISRSHTLKEATDSDWTIFGVGRCLLERALEYRAWPVRLIGIGVSNLVAGRQLDMLDLSAEALVRLNSAIDRIRDKYGFTAIEVGYTLPLRAIFSTDNGRYLVSAPSLSR